MTCFYRDQPDHLTSYWTSDISSRLRYGVHYSIPMRIKVISCRLTNFLKDHLLFCLLGESVTARYVIKSYTVRIKSYKPLFLAPHLQIPPESINKPIRVLTILNLTLLKTLTVASLRKYESLHKIFF